MSIQKVPAVSMSSMCVSSIDEEEKRIMAKLWSYGYVPTGDKTTDKAMLRRIEIEKAKQEDTVSDKFITVSRIEQEKIQEKKKQKRHENNPELYKDNFQGSKALGEQIMLAIEMKKRKKQNNCK